MKCLPCWRKESKMKGLLFKDLMLLKSQKTGLMIMLTAALILAFTSSNGMGSVGFSNFLMMMTITSTFNLDEYNNFLTYLLTTPISKKMYIQSKYIFASLALLLTWFLSVCILFICNWIKGQSVATNIVMASLIIPLIVLILFSFSIPFLIKFGPEKGRIIMAAAMGSVFGLCYYIMQMFVDLSLDFNQPLILGNIFIIISIICLIAVLISYAISLRVMEKKDY